MPKGIKGFQKGNKAHGKAGHTLEAAERLKYIKQRVNEATGALMDAQLSLARGVSFLYVRRKTKDGKNQKPELIQAPEIIEAYLRGDFDHDEDYYYITTERPDNKAIDSLLDRTHGKPAQTLQGNPDEPIRVKVELENVVAKAYAS